MKERLQLPPDAPHATVVAMNEEAAIAEVLSRGVERIYPSPEEFKQALRSGRKLRFYLGIDPTGPTLHIGHSVVLHKLRELQDLGHEITLLIGDFTGMIGDPTDKGAARVRLTRREVLANSKTYQKQASAILRFTGKNPAKLKYNSTWLSKLSFADVIDLAAHLTVEQLMKRDMFKKRLEEGRPVYLHEFLYPVMQGYDSVAMKVDGELGGNDQTFNMLVGRTLPKQILGKEKFVIAMKLLTDPSGKKMGKSEGNMVALSDSADEMFGKVMRWTDGMIVLGFLLTTRVGKEDVARIEARLAEGENPRDAKLELAQAVVAIYHGDKAAARARESFLRTFSEGAVPENIKEVSFSGGTLKEAVLAVSGASASSVSRLIEQGGVEVDGVKITDPKTPVSGTKNIRVGKKAFWKIVPK